MGTLTEYLSGQPTFGQAPVFALRLITACLCGACIGFERSRRFKEAGIRTHVIVCCTAALIMIVSKYGFADLVLPDGTMLHGTRGADPARIAAQIVSGISFLCAGVIFKNGSTIKGLTTAAGIWATAAIGMAMGSGMYAIGLFATAIVATLQIVTHRFTVGADAYAASVLTFTVREDADLYALLQPKLAEWGAVIRESRVSRISGGRMEYRLTVRARRGIDFSELDTFIREHGEILSGANQRSG